MGRAAKPGISKPFTREALCPGARLSCVRDALSHLEHSMKSNFGLSLFLFASAFCGGQLASVRRQPHAPGRPDQRHNEDAE